MVTGHRLKPWMLLTRSISAPVLNRSFWKGEKMAWELQYSTVKSPAALTESVTHLNQINSVFILL